MRLVQVKLRPSVPFWFIGDVIKLSGENKMSDFFDVDVLDEETRRIINLSIFRHQIMAFDYNGERIASLDDAKYFSGNHAIDINDIEEEQDESDLLPDFVSVTDEIIEEEEEEEDKLSDEPSEEHIENAKILLEQNGNTVKRMIRNMTKTVDDFMLLKAGLRQELAGKKRKGIITALERAIAEY